MAEPVVVVVNHSTVLDEAESGQPLKKKNDTGSKSPGEAPSGHTHTHTCTCLLYLPTFIHVHAHIYKVCT